MKRVITILSLALLIFACAGSVEAKSFKSNFDSEIAITDYSDQAISVTNFIVVEEFAYVSLETKDLLAGSYLVLLVPRAPNTGYNQSGFNLTKRTNKKVSNKGPPV